jgi:transcriptional regulator with XRE-family HTH domain
MDKKSQELARTIGKQIAKARRSLDLTQEEAAERIGITVEYYGRVERGRALPSLFTFVQISVALQVSADSLISLGEIMARPVAVPPPWFAAPQLGEDKQLGRLFRRLRRVHPEVIGFVEAMLKPLERLFSQKDKKTPRDGK